MNDLGQFSELSLDLVNMKAHYHWGRKETLRHSQSLTCDCVKQIFMKKEN